MRHDARGNAVWQWASDTARHAIASTSQLLRRLEVSDIKLEAPDETKLPRGEAGFNPYEGAAVGRSAPASRPGAKSTAASKAPTTKRPTAPPPSARRSWWRRLLQRR